MTIKYLQTKEVQDQKINELVNWQRYANITGYGSKIPTRYMLKMDNRWYRVYCICYSNSGSLYVLKNKETLFLDIDTEIKLNIHQLELQSECHEHGGMFDDNPGKNTCKTCEDWLVNSP